MKLLHTSDWHLGRQFHNASLLDDQKVILERILQFIDDHAIDGVIIAGDIYDRSVPPASAVKLLSQWLTEVITVRSISVFMISGNHDSAERLGFASTQLQATGLSIVSNLSDMLTPTLWSTEHEQVQIVGLPFIEPAIVKHHYPSQADSIKDAHDAHAVALAQLQTVLKKDTPSICVSHCFIDGSSECESERALSVGGSERVGYQLFEAFDYTALGHLHQQQFRGEQHIRYSGSPMKYSFSEQYHNKGVTVLEIAQGKVANIEHHSIRAPKDMRIIEGPFDELIAAAASDPAANDYLLARMTDHHAILDPMTQLREVYPNILHLERPGLVAEFHPEFKRDALKRNELDVFSDFFKQVSGERLSDEQQKALQQVVADVRKEAE